MYMASPEYMASYARRMVEAGARFVGGCCGTTPDHIRAIVGFVQSVSPAHVHTVTAHRSGGGVGAGAAGGPLAHRLQAGGGALHHDGGDRAAQGRGSGADVRAGAPAQGGRRGRGERARRAPGAEPDGSAAVGAHDRARGRSRGGGSLRLPRPQPARHAVRPARRGGRGHPQSPHRHRRSAEDGTLSRGDRGLRHRQHRTHQPRVAGSTAGSTPAAIRSASRRSSSSASASIPPRRISSASSSASPGRSRPARSGPSPSRCSTWRSSTGSSSGSESFRIPIVAGIWPLISLRNAEFLANEVPGVTVPDEILERMRRGQRRGQGRGAGGGRAHLAGNARRRVERVQGAQVSAPLGRVPVALEVCGPLRLNGDDSGYTPTT